MMSRVIRKIVGFTVAGFSGLLVLLCLYLLFTTRSWLWLFVAGSCAALTAAVVALTLGHMTGKEFIEELVDLITFFPQ